MVRDHGSVSEVKVTGQRSRVTGERSRVTGQVTGQSQGSLNPDP